MDDGIGIRELSSELSERSLIAHPHRTQPDEKFVNFFFEQKKFVKIVSGAFVCNYVSRDGT
jgi:hypothetical protein